MATLTTGNVRQSTAVPRLSSNNEGTAFGDFLRNARERRGLTLQQISRETKISLRHLDALEHGELAAVPQGIYRRAQIRAFAQTVGLDQNVALAELERALEATPLLSQPSSSINRASPARKNRALLAAAIIALSSLAVSALTMWSRGMASPVDVQGPASGEPVVATAPPDVPVQRASTREVPASEVAPAIAISAPPTPTVEAQAIATPEEPPTTQPLVESGQLTIVTEPAGARVTIDGMGRGTTPLTIANVALGTHRVRVTLDGFVGQERTAQLDRARPNANLQISLQAAQ